MRPLIIRNLSFCAVSVGLLGCLAAYVRSETAPQRLGGQGIVTARTRAIVRGNTAYVVGPPEVVADLVTVQQMEVSPDTGAVLIGGLKARPYRAAAATTTDVEAGLLQRFPELNLMYWDTRTRTAQTLYREKLTEKLQSDFEDLAWFPGTRVALVVLSDYTGETYNHRLFKVNPATGTVTRLLDLTHHVQMAMSPHEPTAFIYTGPEYDEKETDAPPTLRFYTPQNSSPPISLPEQPSYLRWSSDGKYVYSRKSTTVEVDGKQTRRTTFMIIDVETRQVSFVDKLPAAAKVTEEAPVHNEWSLRLENVADRMPGAKGKSAPEQALRLLPTDSAAPPKPATLSASAAQGNLPEKTMAALLQAMATDSLLVSSEVTDGQLMTGQSTAAVLFEREGILYASPVFRMPVDALARGLYQAQKLAAGSNAKQVGLGILQYIQDYDEIMPQPGSAVADTIFPYVKDRSVFENPLLGTPGFVYTYKGVPSAAQIEAVATTEMGYVSGIGGRAIIWADGHVTWKDDP